MAYVVKAPMVYANCSNGTTVPVMRDGVLPLEATEEHVAHLLEFGLVVEAEPVGGLPQSHPGDGSDDAESADDDVFVDDVDGDGPIPAKSAAKADWVAYAVSQGADQAEAEASTKDDLISTYGG